MDLKVETTLSSRPQVEPNDATALTSHQQASLDEQKVTVRIRNEQYLRQHPEIPLMLESFLQKVLLNKPQNIKVFASSKHMLLKRE
jgi:hypothetical protein